MICLFELTTSSSEELSDLCLSGNHSFGNSLMEVQFFTPDQKYFGQENKEFIPNVPHRHVVINGFPYDEGTRINGGRVGGSAATTIFRKYLHSHQIYKKEPIEVYDSQDIEEDLSLEQAHEALYNKNMSILSNPNSILCVFGGSNDQSFPNARSLIDTYPQQKIAVINIDAHFDVRPLKEGRAHSGSPFRLLLESKQFQDNNSVFVEFGNKGASCSNQHFEFLKQKGVEVIWLEKDIRRYKVKEEEEQTTQAGQMIQNLLDRLCKEVEQVFISFDVDSISVEFMPGVSAPSIVGGLTANEAFEVMAVAGKNPKVKLVDFSEFNPAVENIRSGRLLVQLFYSFCMGVTRRT